MYSFVLKPIRKDIFKYLKIAWLYVYNISITTSSLLSIPKIYPDAIFQYRDQWLGYLSLDIYIPSLKAAIEYQGQQHYEPVSHFGGKKTYDGISKRDLTKKELCSAKNIKLIEWKYDVEITDENVKKLISELPPSKDNG